MPPCLCFLCTPYVSSFSNIANMNKRCLLRRRWRKILLRVHNAMAKVHSSSFSRPRMSDRWLSQPTETNQTMKPSRYPFHQSALFPLFFSPWTLLQVNSHGGPAQSKCRRNVATIWRSHWTDSKTSCLASTVQVPRSVAFHQFTPGKCAHRIPRRKVLKWMLLRLRFTRFDGGTQNRISCGLPDEI